MRILPILTALIVAAVLYGLIMERDRLQSLAGITPTEENVDVSEVRDIAARSGTEPVSVVVQRSEARPVQSGIRVTGQTEAARKVDIRAETTGQVISDPIRKGSEIAEGDVLCKLDPGTRQAQLAEAPRAACGGRDEPEDVGETCRARVFLGNRGNLAPSRSGKCHGCGRAGRERA